jgi:hypothetical protein
MTRVAVLGALMITASACQQEAAAPANGEVGTAEVAGTEPFNGTWKADLASVKIDEQPSVYLLKDGTYTCSTCKPPLTLAADGAFHPIADRPYWDSASKTVVDATTVKSVYRKGDKTIGENVSTISADGNTLTTNWRDTPVGQPEVKGTTIETRVGPAPAGAHAISGSWKTAKFEGISEEGLTVTFNASGDSLSMTSPAGQSYTATFGGPEVAIKGDAGGTMVKVERLAPNSFRETSSRKGKVVNVTTTTVGDDGKLNVVSENKEQGSTMQYSAIKHS